MLYAVDKCIRLEYPYNMATCFYAQLHDISALHVLKHDCLLLLSHIWMK